MLSTTTRLRYTVCSLFPSVAGALNLCSLLFFLFVLLSSLRNEARHHRRQSSGTVRGPCPTKSTQNAECAESPHVD
uniref:Secreted protein n=1 Tax=Steinernema glaseri TaxID=37863 RepID=A0A1I7ZTM2_9BILA